MLRTGRRKGGRLDTTRALQAAFLVLLAVCFLQVLFWIVDETRYMRRFHERLVAVYEHDRDVARQLVEKGMDPNEVDRLFPHLTFSSGPERVAVNPQFLAEQREEQRRRAVRYGAEGSFFLLVLAASMAVILHAIRRDTELRRRQQNFLAAVTHEFKSPLAALKLTAETLALRTELPPAKRQQLVQRILDDLGRLEGMIGNILDTAKLEEGKVLLRRERVGLSGAVRAVLDEVGGRAQALGVAVVSDVPDGLETEADPVAVRTVLRNLVDNAIKATVAKGGGTVAVAARADGRAAVVEVKDDGIGFPAAEGPRLFEKFYRPGDELRRTSPGSGLGLYIVQRFVALTGGKVAAHSDGPGQGATFRVDWPLAPPEKENAA